MLYISFEIHTIKIDTDMMSPTINLGDTVNAVKISNITYDGVYVLFSVRDNISFLKIHRIIWDNEESIYQFFCDNNKYPKSKKDRQFKTG